MKKRLLGLALLLPTIVTGILGYWNWTNTLAQTQTAALQTSNRTPIDLLFHKGFPQDVTAGSHSTIGIVHLAQLLHAHPLHEVLATDDRQLYTLRLLDAAGRSVDHHSEILAAQARLQRQLRAIADEAQQRLHARAAEFTQEEHREILALLNAATHEPQHHPQASAVIAQADTVMTTRATEELHHFTASISAEQREVVQSAEEGLDLQNQVALEAKAAEFSKEESDLGSRLAQQDADERMRLRLRQANLKLSDADQQAVSARLKELDDGEALALAAKKAQDQSALTQLGHDLRTHRVVTAGVAAQNAQVAGQGALTIADQAAAPLPSDVPQTPTAVTPAPVDPALRARIAALHQHFQGRFDQEEAESLKAFKEKRAILQAEFTALAQSETTQQGTNLREFRRLTDQRGQLYSTLLTDIQRVIAQVAAEHGMKIVLVDPLGVAPGVLDVTNDVALRLAHEVR